MGSPFSAPLYAIRAASARLQDPSCEGRQLLPSTTEINKQTAIVRATALELAERSSNPAIKHFYMGAAKEVTGLTAAVVQSVTVRLLLLTDVFIQCAVLYIVRSQLGPIRDVNVTMW